MEKREKLRQILQVLKHGQKTINKAHHQICVLFGVSTPSFPVYEIGKMVKWQGSDFWVVEDNGDHNVLIANTPDLNDPKYNYWWVNKAHVC